MPQEAAAEASQTGKPVKLQKSTKLCCLHMPATVENVIDTRHQTGSQSNPPTHATGQQADQFFSAGMHELGEIDRLFRRGIHVFGNSRKSCRACFQISNSDHIIIGHGIGEIFCCGNREAMTTRCSASTVVKGPQCCKSVKIFTTIGHVLKVNHAFKARQGERLCRQWKLA